MKKKLLFGVFALVTMFGVLAGYSENQSHTNQYAERGIVPDSTKDLV
ncbi:hypothetical protein ACQKP0_09315 [Heyndrickxia sp. NPDC080065]